MNKIEIQASDVQVEVKLDEELESLGGLKGSGTTSYTSGCSSSNLTDSCCW